MSQVSKPYRMGKYKKIIAFPLKDWSGTLPRNILSQAVMSRARIETRQTFQHADLILAYDENKIIVLKDRYNHFISFSYDPWTPEDEDYEILLKYLFIAL